MNCNTAITTSFVRQFVGSLLLLLLLFSEVRSQCPQFIGTLACTNAAPAVVGASFSCTPLANNGGRRNLQVTGMVAGCVYQVSNCGSGFDTQLSIFNSTGTAVGFGDDNGPACPGTAASLNFTCPADGTYNIQLNRYNCSTTNQLNGTITVTLLSCGPPPPPCSDCTNATVINSLPFNGNYTTCGACNSVASGQGCTSNYLGGEDYLFTYTPALSGNVDITLTGTLTFTGVFVVQGCPTAGGTCVANNTNGAGNPAITGVALTAGVQYYIIVDTWPAPACTPFTMNIQPAAPPPAAPSNDLVCNATPIACGQTLAGTTINATLTGTGEVVNACGGTATQPGVWYSVAGNGQIMTASLCGTAAWDSRIQIFSGANCNTITCVGGNDDGGPACAGGPASFLWTSVVGVNYYILVSGYSSNSAFNVALTCIVPPPPPVNDLICNATPIACGQTLNGTTVDATPSGTGEGLACGGFTQSQPGVWYSIVGTGNNINVALCGTAWDSRVQVFSGANCSTVACVGGNDNNGPLCAGNAASYSWLAANGQTYYILVSGVTNNSAFSITAACQTPCTASCNGGPPPANDACGGAQNLGAIPAPAACPNGVGAPVNFSTTNICATAEPNYTSLLGCQPAGNQATPAADVWYRFSIVAPVLNITINGLGTPNVALYEGANCANLLPRGCAIGSGGLLNAQIQGLAPGTYYLQVSGGDVLDQCNFTLTLQNNYDCQGCVLGATLDATPPPVNGQYQPGTLVTFCYQVSSYSQINANWLHGVIPSFGPGWDLSTFVALPTSTVTQGVIAPSCTPNGTWSWYNTPITSSFSGVSYGPGFFFETAAGSGGLGVDGNPGNNYGDNNPGASAPNTNPNDDCIWTFCWQIRTKQLSQCAQDQGLNVSINTTGDSESGSYGSVACVLDPLVTFFSQSNCCPTPTVTITNPTCAVPTGSVVGQGLGSSPWTYEWKNAAGVTLLTNANTAGTSTITGLAAGDYTLTVTDAAGCASFIAFSIVPPAGNTVSNSSANPTLCVNAPLTAITFTTTGATGIGAAAQLPAGVTASFSGNATAGTITLTGTPTAAGNFNYSIPLTGGCGNLSALGNITVNPLMTATSASPNATVCQNQALSPNIVFNTTGATGIGAALNLPPGLIATFAGNAAAGTVTISGTPTSAVSSPYSYSIPLTGGCGTVNATGTITVVPSINVTITSTNPTCPSACNGTANVIVTGGAAPYTYTWTGPSAASGPNPTNLCAGIYTVSVTGGGCTSQSSAPIPTSCFEIQSILVDACGTPENIGEMVFFQVGPTGLNTSSLGLTWATATQPYNGLCTNPTFIANVNATITGGGSLVAAPAVLPPGASVVLITGNTATTSANLFTNLSSTLYVLFQCTQSSTAGHFGNSNGTGLRTFSMNFGAGCSDQVNYTAESLIGGDGASVVYNAAGVPSYINTACTAPFLPPSSGTLVLTSVNPDVQVTASNSSICSGSSTTLTATGASSYTWSPAVGLSATTGASVSAAPTVSTTYTVTGSSGTCVESAEVTITVGPQPTATIAYSATSFCSSVSAAQPVTISGTSGGTFSAPAGLTINTSTGAITPSSSTPGSYLVTYTIPAAGSCPAGIATVSVAIIQTPLFTSTPTNLTTCSGPDIASASSPTYNPLSGGTPTLVPSTSTMNWTNSLGQSATGVTTVNNPVPNSTCSPLSVSYTITPVNNGCLGTPISFPFIYNPKPTSTFTVSANPVCSNQTVTVTYTGVACPGATYNWTWPAGVTVVSGSGAGPYTISFGSIAASINYPLRLQVVGPAALGGCPSTTTTVNLGVNPLMTVSSSIPRTACQNQALSPTIQFTTTGATGVGTATGLPAGITHAFAGNATAGTITLSGTPTASGIFNYNIPLTGGCGTVNATGTITVVAPPTANLTSSTSICPGSSSNINFTGTALATLSWSTNSGATGNFVFNPSGAANIGPSSINAAWTTWPAGTVITFTQVTINTCSTPINFVVTVTSSINVTVTAQSPICSGSTAQLTFTGTPSATVTYNVGAGNLITNTGPTGTVIVASPTLTASTNATVTLAQIAGGCNQILSNVSSIVVTPPNTVGVPSSNPTLCVNSIMSPITIATNGATGIGTPSGLPAGVTPVWNANVITISGTPTAAGTYNYSIPLTGGCGTVNATGTITVSAPAIVTLSYGGPFCPAFNSVPPTNSWAGGGTYSVVPSGLDLNAGTGLIALNTSIPGTYTVTFTPVGCAAPAIASVTINDVLDFVNLQFPPSGTICATGSFNAFGQVFNDGSITTIPGGPASGITAQIGYSTSNSNPSSWTTWTNAPFNAQVGNNDEFIGTVSGLAAGTYYYAFRYQINGCAWQYGALGGAWNGTSNNSGVLTVTAPPQAGNDGTVTLCASGSPVNLFQSLGALAASNGTWTGPSTLTGGNLGTFNPLTNTPGAYTYTVAANGCPDDVAVVTVTLTASPSASLAYPSPICKNEIAPVSPSLSGAPGGTYSVSPSGLTINSSTGVITVATSAIGNYTVSYNVPAANGCGAYSATANVSVVAAPVIPTLGPSPACTNTTTFTAAGGNWYEFLVNGTSQGPASATATLSAGVGLAAGTEICVRSYLPPPLMDGALNDPAWGPEIAGSTGGAASSFGANRIDGLKLLNRNGVLYGAVAGSEEDGVAENLNYRIALFIDCRAGGFNNLAAWTNRGGANSNTGGLVNLNNGIVFDAGFEADYILTMNRYNGQTFYDLYDMVANTNNYLGNGPSAQFGFQQNASEGDLSKGFEFSFPLSALGSPSGAMKFFGMLINDPPGSATTTIGNQFITPANMGENSYGDVAVFFNDAAPNPVLYQISQDCYEQACVTVQQSVTPNFVFSSPLCYGAAAPILSSPSPNGVSGSWLPASVSTTTTGLTNYTFTPNAGGCAQSQTISITILPQILTTLIFHN